MNKPQEKKFLKRKRDENPDFSRSRILQDPFLKYSYSNLLSQVFLHIQDNNIHKKVALEIGSAGGITDQIYPGVITSDVRISEGVSELIDASRSIPYPAGSIDILIAKDVLHHLPSVSGHFEELNRVLRQGGKAIYSEPNWNFLSRMVFTFIHPEPFDRKQKNWHFSSAHPMYSNQALAWIIFKRDAQKFRNLYPHLEFEILPTTINGLSFLLSGGVYKRNFIPSRFLIKIAQLEHRHDWWMKFVGFNRLIVITKK